MLREATERERERERAERSAAPCSASKPVVIDGAGADGSGRKPLACVLSWASG